jgi:hypothetical protein
MKVYSRFITRIHPQLGKNELRLCLILLDLCNKEENTIDVDDLHNHPVFVNTIKHQFNSLCNNIVGKKILCGKYTTEATPIYTIFESIQKTKHNIIIKLTKSALHQFQLGWNVSVNPNQISALNKLTEIKFFLWVKTWIGNKERRVDIDVLKTYMGVTSKNKCFLMNYIKPLTRSLWGLNIYIDYTKIYKKNSKKNIHGLHFKEMGK